MRFQSEEHAREWAKRYEMEDPQGEKVFEYAARWAELMDRIIMTPGPFNEEQRGFIDRTSIEADVEGITASMQTAATHLLIRYWMGGHVLQQWFKEKFRGADPELFSAKERRHIENKEDRFAIRNLAVSLMERMILNEEIDINDKEAMKKAAKTAGDTAAAAYYATLEYISR